MNDYCTIAIILLTAWIIYICLVPTANSKKKEKLNPDLYEPEDAYIEIKPSSRHYPGVVGEPSAPKHTEPTSHVPNAGPKCPSGQINAEGKCLTKIISTGPRNQHPTGKYTDVALSGDDLAFTKTEKVESESMCILKAKHHGSIVWSYKGGTCKYGGSHSGQFIMPQLVKDDDWTTGFLSGRVSHLM